MLVLAVLLAQIALSTYVLLDIYYFIFSNCVSDPWRSIANRYELLPASLCATLIRIVPDNIGKPTVTPVSDIGSFVSNHPSKHALSSVALIAFPRLIPHDSNVLPCAPGMRMATFVPARAGIVKHGLASFGKVILFASINIGCVRSGAAVFAAFSNSRNVLIPDTP